MKIQLQHVNNSKRRRSVAGILGFVAVLSVGLNMLTQNTTTSTANYVGLWSSESDGQDAKIPPGLHTSPEILPSRSAETSSPWSHLDDTIALPEDDARKGPANTVDLPFCDRDQIVDGSWQPRRYDRLPYLPQQIESKSCYGPENIMQPWDTYEWYPRAFQERHCQWGDDWNRDEFCELARGQSIAMVGDSLTLEHFSALVHMLGVTDFHEEVTFRDNINTFEYHVCPHNTTKISLYRNNHLRYKGTRKFLLREEVNGTGQHDLVILNRGSWYQPDVNLLQRIQELVTDVLTPWQNQCLQRRQQQQQQLLQGNSNSSSTDGGTAHSFCRVVWRTTVPGHPQCTSRPEFTTPATSLEEMEAWISNISHYNAENHRYHWYDFQHQNRLVEDLFVNLTGAGKNKGHNNRLEVDILDAHKINILRPDDRIAHTGKKDDCLHNCQPGGSTMFYNQWLLHLMRRTRHETNKLLQQR